MKIKTGFTLSEVMITLTVLGILAAVLIPAITSNSPDTNKVLFKKAYFTAEKAINDMVSDDSIYPSEVTGTTTDSNISVSKGLNNQTTTGMGISGSDDKFCYLLSQRLNTVGAVDCATGSTDKKFITTDGVAWHVGTTTFELNATAYTGTANAWSGVDVLYVDVNGTKAPNCQYNATTCAKPDQFKIRIRYDGKMSIDPNDAVAVEALTNPTKNTK